MFSWKWTTLKSHTTFYHPKKLFYFNKKNSYEILIKNAPTFIREMKCSRKNSSLPLHRKMYVIVCAQRALKKESTLLQAAAFWSPESTIISGVLCPSVITLPCSILCFHREEKTGKHLAACVFISLSGFRLVVNNKKKSLMFSSNCKCKRAWWSIR